MAAEERIGDYLVPEGCRDELLERDGTPHPHAAPLIAALRRLGPRALEAAGERRDAIFMQQGITFEVAGTDGDRRDRAWPLDLVPRVLTAAEWTTIKRGLAQRIRALNAFVDDVYHAHEIVRAEIVPWSMIVSRPSFARPVHGVRAPGGVYCHVSGCDLVRGGDGRWRVLLQGGAGVCQDFVHLGLAILRHLWIAARYVSGYLFAAGGRDGGERDGGGHHGAESVEVDTHAWLEALRPGEPGPGGSEPIWVGADPTNRRLVGSDHVKIGHGRHYPDVPPIKGVYRGTTESRLEASVTMTRLDRSDPASIARS